MNDLKDDYDPYQEMKRFYSMSDPSEVDQFRFVEAMEYLIKNAYFPEDIPVYSFNLAKSSWDSYGIMDYADKRIIKRHFVFSMNVTLHSVFV